MTIYIPYHYNINSGYLLFFETTIMEKTADLAMIQKMVIDTLHKEGESHKSHFENWWLFTDKLSSDELCLSHTQLYRV